VFIFSGGSDFAEYDNGAAVASPSREFIYSTGISGSGLLASISAGTITYFHSAISTWRVSTDVNLDYWMPCGALLPSLAHCSWAMLLVRLNDSSCITRKEGDTETGLEYFGARYYVSNMGLFMSPDPLCAGAKLRAKRGLTARRALPPL
jgi:hypothetical protein